MVDPPRQSPPGPGSVRAALRERGRVERGSGLKRIFDDAVCSFAGSREAFLGLEWRVVTFILGSNAQMGSYPSFKAIMADKAWRTGTENDAKGGMHESRCLRSLCAMGMSHGAVHSLFLGG